MNYIKHLTGFFEKVTGDKALNPTHISLYIALFQFWNCNRFKNPISISRDEVMRISKISSKATYHKCLKALHSQGYIKYEPSYNPFKGSHVFLFNFSDDLKPLSKSEKLASPNFEPVVKQVVNKLQTACDTTAEQVVEQVLVPYINNTNIINNSNIENSLNLQTQAKNLQNEDSIFFKDEEEISKEKKLREKKKSVSDSPIQIKNNHKTGGELVFEVPVYAERSRSTTEEPKFEEVKSYFQENNFPELEANKFFNYFKSIGWLVGGKTPMADWQAAARNWMLNAPKFISNERTDGSKHFDTASTKDYSEPL